MRKGGRHFHSGKLLSELFRRSIPWGRCSGFSFFFWGFRSPRDPLFTRNRRIWPRVPPKRRTSSIVGRPLGFCWVGVCHLFFFVNKQKPLRRRSKGPNNVFPQIRKKSTFFIGDGVPSPYCFGPIGESPPPGPFRGPPSNPKLPRYILLKITLSHPFCGVSFAI